MGKLWKAENFLFGYWFDKSSLMELPVTLIRKKFNYLTFVINNLVEHLNILIFFNQKFMWNKKKKFSIYTLTITFALFITVMQSLLCVSSWIKKRLLGL